MSHTVDAARQYKARGWNPLPLKPGEKKPTGSEWQRTQIADEHLETAFTDRNVGVGLGPISGGLYDADLDEAITVKMQRHFMPKTPAIFGRPSKPDSHLIYRDPNGGEFGRKTYKDVDGTLLAELRGKGHQTMFPPSIHPSGEQVAWKDPLAEPAEHPINTISQALGWLASAAMLARGWDNWNDSHHVLTLSLAGGFARSGVGHNLAEQFVRAVGIYSGDHEIDDRVRTVRDTYAKYEADPDSTELVGFPTLAEIIGADRVGRLLDWLPLNKQAQDASRRTMTDDGNAYRFVEKYGKTLKYVHEWGKWLLWDGSRWLEDKRENVIAFAREIPVDIDVEAAKILDDDLRKIVDKWANASRNVNRIKAIPTLARTDPTITVASDLLDADPYQFNVQNGTINLRTGGLSPHDKSDLITKLSPITFNPRAQCPYWLDYLKLVFEQTPEVIPFAQRAVGYSLTAATKEQAFFILHGPQGTGKTTFIETLRVIFGDYAANADPSTFMQKQKTSRANPDIARLQGARFVSSSETEENERLAAGVVKRLSGSTKITAAHLYAPDFEYTPVMKLWIDTNHKPKISAHDDAVWARLILIPFQNQIRGTPKEIKGLHDILMTELPGILRWAVEGCTAWFADGLMRPQAVTDAATDYRDESDVVQAFIDDVCIVEPGAQSGSLALYRAYAEWCESANERPLTMRLFKSRLIEHRFENKRTERGFEWFGIRPASERATAEPLRQQQSPFQRPHA